MPVSLASKQREKFIAANRKNVTLKTIKVAPEAGTTLKEETVALVPGLS